MPPHEHIHLPPHALPVRNSNKVKFFMISFIVSSMFAVLFALALNLFGISVNVIVPSTAPVWMGILTIGYMVQVEK